LIEHIATRVERQLVDAGAQNAERDDAKADDDYRVRLFACSSAGNCPFARGLSDRRIASRRSLAGCKRRANGEKQNRCENGTAHGVAPGEITCASVGQEWMLGKEMQHKIRA